MNSTAQILRLLHESSIEGLRKTRRILLSEKIRMYMRLNKSIVGKLEDAEYIIRRNGEVEPVQDH